MAKDYDVRRAHDLLDDLDARAELSQEQEKLLRSFLPELPKQKTLEEITAHVYDAWLASSDYEFNGNEYDPDVTIEDWLLELHKQLKGLAPAESAHPEFLETEADYENAPAGTVVASAKASPAMKGGLWWESSPYMDRDAKTMAGESRRVLRWGWGE